MCWRGIYLVICWFLIYSASWAHHGISWKVSSIQRSWDVTKWSVYISKLHQVPLRNNTSIEYHITSQIYGRRTIRSVSCKASLTLLPPSAYNPQGAMLVAVNPGNYTLAATRAGNIRSITLWQEQYLSYPSISM